MPMVPIKVSRQPTDEQQTSAEKIATCGVHPASTRPWMDTRSTGW
jgi:hypothetical protein